MMVWAVTPAREPARNLSCTRRLAPSLVPRINHLIYGGKKRGRQREREMVEEYQEEGGNGVVGTGVDNVGRAHMT